MDYGYVWYDGDSVISLGRGDIQPTSMIQDIVETLDSRQRGFTEWVDSKHCRDFTKELTVA